MGAPRKTTNLRAVTQADTPPPKLTVEAAAASGDHRALLIAMRERVARAVSSAECPPRDLAALTRRLQDIAGEIKAMDLRSLEEGADVTDAAPSEVWNPEAL